MYKRQNLDCKDKRASCLTNCWELIDMQNPGSNSKPTLVGQKGKTMARSEISKNGTEEIKGKGFLISIFNSN